VEQKTSVLEALLRLQDEQDPTLAFRYCCRGAICGSCAMSINGKLNLACRVQLQSLPAARVVLEPLPGFEILKDLVVDMGPFWEKYRRTEPWLHAEIAAAKETRMSPDQLDRFQPYVQCILCGLCHAACPARRSNGDFTGPAALTKLYRFLADAREERGGGTLLEEDSADGLWGCRTIMKCVEVCPKEVRPADAIRAARRRLVVERIKRLVGGKPRED
jgi:succinate dehydrogenase / fumarate reductase iron-sulfur subunit